MPTEGNDQNQTNGGSGTGTNDVLKVAAELKAGREKKDQEEKSKNDALKQPGTGDGKPPVILPEPNGAPLVDSESNELKALKGKTAIFLETEELNEFLEFRKQKAAKAAQTETAPVDPETEKAAAAAAEEAALVKKYGVGYVKVENPFTKANTIFTKDAWSAIGGDKNVAGWKRSIPVPAEIQALRDQQSKAAATGGGNLILQKG